MQGDVPFWEFIPAHVRGDEVYKSFVYGFTHIIEAMSAVISPAFKDQAPKLPTARAIQHELEFGRSRIVHQCDNRKVDHYLGRGGKIEFALDGLITSASVSEEFFDGDLDTISEHNKIPAHILDNCWSLVHFVLLGHATHVTRAIPSGPFSQGHSWEAAAPAQGQSFEDRFRTMFRLQMLLNTQHFSATVRAEARKFLRG